MFQTEGLAGRPGIGSEGKRAEYNMGHRISNRLAVSCSEKIFFRAGARVSSESAGAMHTRRTTTMIEVTTAIVSDGSSE